jgi:drug/metabolite transporter (DMT)-like permease
MLAPPAMIEIAVRGLGPISARGWIATIYLGALASAVCYLIYNHALRVLDAAQVGTFVNLVPLIGVISGVIFLGESLHPMAIAGGALILTGVWLSSRASSAVTEARDPV